MNGTYSYPLPKELVTHVSAICGRDGDEWLAGLRKQIDELTELWSIHVEAPFAAGEFNFVAPATRRNGELAVLKIAPPYTDDEYLREAEFLRVRDGRGAVQLLAEDADRHAILIERAVPGKNLAEIFTGRERDALEPAIKVLRDLLDPPPPDLKNIKTIDQWFDGLRRFRETNFPAEYAAKALRIYESLSASGRPLYLHGDYHPANVVNSERLEYLAIDPKGVVGHIGYDIAVFLNNFHWWQEKQPDVRDRLAPAIEEFSNAFDIDPVEIRQWAYAQMVLSAWWSFDEMPQFYDNIVAKADIWDV